MTRFRIFPKKRALTLWFMSLVELIIVKSMLFDDNSFNEGATQYGGLFQMLQSSAKAAMLF